jgi:hypothetical protein
MITATRSQVSKAGNKQASSSTLLIYFPTAISQAPSLSNTGSTGVMNGVRAEESYKEATFGGKAFLSN